MATARNDWNCCEGSAVLGPPMQNLQDLQKLLYTSPSFAVPIYYKITIINYTLLVIVNLIRPLHADWGRLES